MTNWNPLVKASAMIMAITLMVVAATASRMINLEKDLLVLKATFLAIYPAKFKRHGFSRQI